MPGTVGAPAFVELQSIGDPELLATLAALGGVRPLSDLPNAAFIAGDQLTLGNFDFFGEYLYLRSDRVTLNSVVGTWLPGSEGQGVADVLFGDHHFTGKLSFSWPRDAGKTPNIGDPDYNPLFPYGHGLRYG